MASSMRSPRIYHQLRELDEGFAQVNRALNRMRSIRGFQTNELARYSALTAEARAATLSYLLEIVGEAESKEAGRLFRSRRRREAREDDA
jgi:hypothetical protein